MSCRPGCRWLARVLRFGRSRNRRHWGRAIAPELVAQLPGTPVRSYRRGARLVHPPDALTLHEGLLTGVVVGVVEAAWSEPGGILAHLHLADEATQLRGFLLDLERDGLVSQLGLSLHAHVFLREQAGIGGPTQTITAVHELVALDLVTAPSADGAMLRSLPSRALFSPLTERKGPRDEIVD